MADCNVILSLVQITIRLTSNILLMSSSPELILTRTPSFILTSARSLMTKVPVMQQRAGDEARKAQSHQIIQARTGRGIGVQTEEEPSQSHPNGEVTDKDLLLGGGDQDREREERRPSRDHLEEGGYQAREREDGRHPRDHLEEEGHQDQDREDGRPSRGRLEEGGHQDREREERREGEVLSLRRDLQHRPCLHHRILEGNVLPTLHLTCEVS